MFDGGNGDGEDCRKINNEIDLKVVEEMLAGATEIPVEEPQVPKKKLPKQVKASRVQKKHFRTILSLQNKSRARRFALVKRAQDLALIGLREAVRVSLKKHGHVALVVGREGMFLFDSTESYSALDASQY